MSEPRHLDKIDSQISKYKTYLNRTQATKMNSPFITPVKQPLQISPQKQKDSENDWPDYINGNKQLRDLLQQKVMALQLQREKDKVKYQSELYNLKAQIFQISSQLQNKQKQSQQKSKTIKVLQNQIKSCEQIIKQKDQIIHHLEQYKKQCIQLRLQVKNLKADNKILINNIDRLTREPKSQKKQLLEDKEIRVMKSLYKDTMPSQKYLNGLQEYQQTSQLSNKVALDKATYSIADLKSIIRRLSEEIDLLRRQKDTLINQNQQKHRQLLSEKQNFKILKQGCQAHINIIEKMGDKIQSLERINNTLRKTIEDQSGEFQIDNFQSTRAKAGYFYYKQ